jgi:hypothetical protein
MLDHKWCKFEREIRFILLDKELTKEDYWEIDDLKNGIIALFGIKTGWDTSDIFYQNTLQQINKSIKYLKEKFPNFNHSFYEIENFILGNLLK